MDLGQMLYKLFIGTGILYALIELLVGVCVVRLLTTAIARALSRSKLEKAAHSLILSIIKIVMYSLLALMVASSLGVDVTGVVALASVLTLSVSLALQNMLANVLGGLTVLTNHPFRSGDYVDIGSMSGTVKEVNLTYTTLATADNKIVSIPNSTVSAAQIVNYSAADTRRIELKASASYSTPAETVIAAMLHAAETDKTLSDPAPFAGVDTYGESTITYVLRFWVKSADYWDAYYAVNKRIIEAFRSDGVELSYPHLNVHVDK